VLNSSSGRLFSKSNNGFPIISGKKKQKSTLGGYDKKRLKDEQLSLS
jgi:hypothetical protein